MMSDMISSSHQIFSGDQIKENDLGGACGSWDGGEGVEREKIIRVFGGKTWKKETTWDTYA